MSNASTVAHYIELACREAGSPLNGKGKYELRSALEGMVEEAVTEALRQAREQSSGNSK